MSDQVASLDEVHFTYDGVREVLHGVSAQLDRGKFYALRGPNGAGKSTLVALLTGLLEPTRGTVTLGGSADRVTRSRRSACVYQQLSLFPHLTVADNMLLGMDGEVAGAFWRPSSAHSFASTHLAALGLDLPLDTKCGKLSYASQQQLEIARALLRRPDVLFLDEPTSALDDSARAVLFEMLRRMNADGTTVVLVTHDPGDAAALGAQEINIEDGQIKNQTSEPNFRQPLISSVHETDFSDDDELTPDKSEVEIEDSVATKMFRATLPIGRTCALRFDDAMDRSKVVFSIQDGSSRIHSGKQTWAIERMRNGIRVLTVDRHREILFPSLSVEDNAVLLSRHNGRAIRKKSEEIALLSRLRKAANIAWPAPTSPVSALSGGNQNRLLLASLVEYAPEILVVEEPLMGVDDASHDCIIGLLASYLKTGGRLLIATCFPRDYRHHEQTLRIKYTDLATAKRPIHVGQMV